MSSHASIPTNVMSEAYKKRQIRITKAIDAFSKYKYKSVAACAKEFDIPPSSLRKSLLHGQSKRVAVNLRLSATQELALKEYIKFYNDLDTSLRLPVIREAANYLLKMEHCSTSSSSPPPRIGKDWAGRFVKRNPQLFEKGGEPVVTADSDALISSAENRTQSGSLSQRRGSSPSLPQPPSPLLSPSSLETAPRPHTPARFEDIVKDSQYLLQQIDKGEQIPREILRSYVEGTLACLGLQELMQRDLQSARTAALAEEAQESLTENVVLQDDVVTVKVEGTVHDLVRETEEGRKVGKRVLRR